MKKIIVVILLCFISTLSYSQFYLGNDDVSVINQANKNGPVEIKRQYTSTGTMSLSWSDDKVKVTTIVYFDAHGFSDMTILIPYTRADLKNWIAYFNDKFERKSVNEWIEYVKQRTLRIMITDRNDDSPLSYYIGVVEITQ